MAANIRDEFRAKSTGNYLCRRKDSCGGDLCELYMRMCVRKLIIN